MAAFLTGVAVGVFLLFAICTVLTLVVFGNLRQYSWRKPHVMLREMAARYEYQHTLKQYQRWLAMLPADFVLLKKPS